MIASPACIRLTHPATDYPVLEIDHPSCKARVALHGAHVMEWQPAGHPPVDMKAPEGGGNAHLQILAKLARSLVKAEFTDALRAAATPDEVVALVRGVVAPPGEAVPAGGPAAATPAAATPVVVLRGRVAGAGRSAPVGAPFAAFGTYLSVK